MDTQPLLREFRAYLQQHPNVRSVLLRHAHCIWEDRQKQEDTALLEAAHVTSIVSLMLAMRVGLLLDDTVQEAAIQYSDALIDQAQHARVTEVLLEHATLIRSPQSVTLQGTVIFCEGDDVYSLGQRYSFPTYIRGTDHRYVSVKESEITYLTFHGDLNFRTL